MNTEISPEELNKVLPYLMKDQKVVIVVVKDDVVIDDKIDSALLNKCSIIKIK